MPEQQQPNLVSLPHPLVGAGREVTYAAFRRGETLGEYVRRTGVTVARGPLAVTVNGRPLTARTWRSYRVIDGDYIVMRQAVAGGGGGNKVLRTVAMIAIAIVAVVTQQWYLANGAGMLGMSVGATGAALGIGIAMVGSLLINALLPLPQPKLSNNSRNDSTLYALNGGRNSARLYEPMALVFGRHKITPDLASQPYTEQWGDDSYLYQAFHFGVQPDLAIDEIKIGETAASGFAEVQIERAGANGRFGLIAGNVDTTAGFDLRQTDGWYQRTLSADTTEIQVELAARLYYVTDHGDTKSRQADIELEYRAVGSTTWLPAGEVWASDMYESYWSRGYWTSEEIKISPNYDVDGAGARYRQVWNQTGYDVSLNPAAHVNGSQAGGGFGTQREIWRWRPYQEIDPNRQNNTRGLAPDRIIRTWLTNQVQLIGDSPTNAVRKNIRLPVARGKYEVRVRKTSGDVASNRESNSAAVSQIRCYQVDETDYTGHNRLALRVRATSQLNGAIDSLNAIGSAAAPVWNGTAWVTSPTSNPAWWFLWFARGRRDVNGRRLYGGCIADTRIDIDAIQRWAAFCDAKKLTCNMILNQQKSIAEVLQIIARCGRASPTWQSGKLGVVWDADAEPVAATFAPFNIKAGSFRVDYIGDQTADEVIVQFINPDKSWQTDEVRVTVPGVEYPGNPTTLQLEGCTNADMAGREANLIAASQVYHRRRMSWETDLEGLVVNRGAVVVLSHDLTAWSISGRLIDGGGRTLRLDKPVPPSSEAWMLVQHPDGAMVTLRVESVSDDGLTVVLADEPGFDLPADNPDIVPYDWRWMYDPLQTPGRRVKIVNVEPQNGGDTIRFSAVDDDPAYYACENNLYGYTPPKNNSLFSMPVFDLRVTEGRTDMTTGEVDLTLAWSQVVSSPVDVGWQIRGGSAGQQRVLERRFMLRARTGDVIDFAVTPALPTGPGQSSTLTYVVQGFLAPLPAVTGLTTIYRDSLSWLSWLSWRPVVDYRSPVYEVRIGDSWSNGRQVAVTPLTEMVAVGPGDYWVAARWRSPYGQIVYGEPDSIDVTGASLVRNVLITRDEHPGWTGVLGGQAARRDGSLVLAGSGNVLDIVDVLSEPDFLWYGTPLGEGTYQTHAPVDVGRSVDCLVSFDLNARGESLADNLLQVQDVLALQDMLGEASSAFVRVTPQLRTAGDDGVFGDWRDYVPGLVVARHFDARLLLESLDGMVTPVVDRFSWTVDMPDRREQGTNVAVPAEGLRIDYGAPFNGGPGGEPSPNVLITVIEAAAGDVVELTASTLAGFTVRIHSASGYVARSINWIAQGY